MDFENTRYRRFNKKIIIKIYNTLASYQTFNIWIFNSCIRLSLNKMKKLKVCQTFFTDSFGNDTPIKKPNITPTKVVTISLMLSKMIMPSLSTLLVCSSTQLLSYLSPFLHTILIHQSHQFPIHQCPIIWIIT